MLHWFLLGSSHPQLSKASGTQSPSEDGHSLVSGFQVTVTLYGLDGESEPHHLSDPDSPVFERGGVDVFLLSTLFPLGELRSLRLWHDNSGDRPSW